MPPRTTAEAGPSSWPTTPDSKAPSSFDAPMKTASTASTRPRLSAGVASGTRVDRMNTLTASAPESARSATKATAKLVVTPSTIVPTPNSATATRSVRPTRRLTGRNANQTVTMPAPIPIDTRSHPSPTAPTCRRSSAIAGSSAIAPPNNTANRSSEIAPSRMGWLRTKRRPSTASCMLGRSFSTSVGGARYCGRTQSTVMAATTMNAVAAANGTHGATT